MEYEVKKCLVCNTVIPVDSNAIYCGKSCRESAFRRRHSKVKLAEECLCFYNREVLCSDKECENCGWNPVVEKRRKEALVCQYDQLMPMHC